MGRIGVRAGSALARLCLISVFATGLAAQCGVLGTTHGFSEQGDWRLLEDVDLCSGRLRMRRHSGGAQFASEAAGLRPMAMGRTQPMFLRPLPLVNEAPKSTAPAEPAMPSMRDISRWEEVDHYKELSTPEGWERYESALKALRRDGVSTSTSGTEFRFDPEWVAPEARGLLFEVDADGRPHLLVPRPVWEKPGVKLKLRLLRSWGVRHKWPDEDLLYRLKWGAWDSSEACPRLTSLSANHKAAVERGEQLQTAIDDEVAAHWISPARDVPYTWPVHVAPFNARDKSRGRVRLMANASWPVPSAGDWCDEGGVPYAPNATVDKGSLPLIEWHSMESMGEAASILSAMAAEAGLRTLGWRDDLEKWFRQIPQDARDLWKQGLYWRGKFHCNEHLEMGRVAAANTACRLSYMLAAVLHQELDGEVANLVSELALSDDRFAKLQQIDAQRGALMGSAQQAYWHCQVLQDDFGCVAISDEVTELLYRRLPEVFEKYGVPVALDKREEDGPPAPKWKFLGGWIDMTALLDVLFVAPEEGVAKLQQQVVEYWGREFENKLVPVLWFQRTMGLLEFLCRFLARGRPFLNRGYACLRMQTVSGYAVASTEWLDDVRWFEEVLRANAGVSAVVDPYWLHPGLLGNNSDACRALPDPGDPEKAAGGFGGNVGGVCFAGVFTERELLVCDISTLELVTVAFLVAVLGAAIASGQLKVPGRRRRFVARCDNEAACRVINRGRAHSRPMAEAYRHLAKAEAAFGIEVRAEHIAGKLNPIADDFSRGRIEDALQAMRERGDVPQMVDVPPLWRDIGDVVRAASRASRRAARSAKRAKRV